MRSEDYADLVLQKERERGLSPATSRVIVALVCFNALGDEWEEMLIGLRERFEAGVGISEEELGNIAPEHMREGLVIAAEGVISLRDKDLLEEEALRKLFGAIAREATNPELTVKQLRGLAETLRGGSNAVHRRILDC